MRLDPGAGDITELSVPRDLWVPRFTFHGSSYVNYKINAAYTIGSEYGHNDTAADVLALKVVKQALGGITINDFIDLNFQSFENVVAKLGCVYVDVDHFFYHRNYAGEPSIDNYQAINIRPGYKPLCGNTALAYVRYRHGDSTFARDARQQDFLRSGEGPARRQRPAQPLPARSSAASASRSQPTSAARPRSRGSCTWRWRPSTSPSCRSSSPRTRRSRSTRAASTSRTRPRQPLADPRRRRPVREHLALLEQPGRIEHGARPHELVVLVEHPPPHGHARQHRTRRYSVSTAGLTPTPSSEQTQATMLAPQLPFKLEMPSLISDWATQTGVQYAYYAYRLRGNDGRIHWAYHITWDDTQQIGAYYGLEGTTWTDPPLFASADTRYHGGRPYLEVGNGRHIQDIGWIDNGVLYWVNNTLFDDLTDDQMVALAESCRSAA